MLSLLRRFSRTGAVRKSLWELERNGTGLRKRIATQRFHEEAGQIARVLRSLCGQAASGGWSKSQKVARPGVAVTKGLRSRRGSEGSSEPEHMGRETLRGGTVQESVRVCPQGHDARTASEHLALFPVAPPSNNPPRQTRSGVHLPKATEPRCQRQLMHCRVYAPVSEQIHRAAREINHMSCVILKKPQHSRRIHQKLWGVGFARTGPGIKAARGAHTLPRNNGAGIRAFRGR